MRIFFAAPIALLFAAPALAQGPAWHVSEVSGNVSIVENGRPHPAARGALVPAGAVVATAPGARAVLVRAHDYVVVSPASRVRVPTPQQQTRSGLIQMITDAGTAMFRIQHQSVPHFGVQTPYLAAVVKGTVFTVTVGERGASVQVTEGAVQVSTVDGGAANMIRPGMVATITAADLQLLHVEGETSHDLRSNGNPSAGVATVPPGEAGRYEGPADTPVTVSASVSEGPVSLADATGGLVAGNLGGADRAFAALDSTARTDNHGGRDAAGAGSAHESNGNGGNANAGSGNNSGNGNGNSGNGNGNAGNGNGGGNGNGNGNSGNGNSGNGNGNGGGNGNGNSGNGNAGNGNGGNGNGNSGNGNGNGNAGNGGGNGNGGGSADTGNGSSGNGNGGGNSGNGNGNGNSGSGSGSDDGGNGNSGNGGGNGNSGSGSGDGGNGNSGSDDGNGNGNGHKPHP